MLIYDVLHKERIYHSIVDDLRNYGIKYRFKKNMFKTESSGEKRISKKVFKTPLLYQPLDVVNLSSGAIVHVPVFVSQASTFLEKYIIQEGLFRKAGSQLRQKELIARLDNGGSLGEKHHAIDVANCLKTFFRDLPEPLIPYTYHDLFVHCVMLKTYCVQALLLACILLPPHHLNTLAFFMEFLKKVAIYEKQNKMSIDNLAKVVGPNIMPLQVTTMSAVQMRLELHLIVVKILIENAESIGILPDHITQAISMETIGSTDNELDISDHLRLKFKRKKHRSGSLTRKPHLSASNLNLRMFNGLKKIVGKNAVSEDGNVCDDQRISENSDSMRISNTKSIKKRKVDCADLPNTKKKRVIDKTDKSKKIRLSLDRFVLRKPKTVDESTESCTSIFDTQTERRWSSVCGSCDSQRTYRAYSDGSSHLKLILKDSEVSNELKEYNNMFGDVDVNLSDDNDEQVLLTKNDIKSSEWHTQLNSSSRDDLDNCNEICAFPLKRRLTVNNFETYSHVQVTSVDNQSEEYVTIPKSEYEEIKNRVSLIESRLSQELKCVNNEKNEENDLLVHSVKKVQTAYEKTLEESSIGTTVSTDYLAKKLGKELKIRRSEEHKIIRSPSARKIGSLRRKSQERMMSKRVRRTASWHISRGSDLQSHIQPNQDLRKKKIVMSWKDADGYFKSTNQTNTPVTQTGRASIAKLRTQNAGMVLAKAKLFDECTAKTYFQNASMSKKNDLHSIENDQCTNTKQNCKGMELHRRSSKNTKNRNSKTVLKHSPSCNMMEIESKTEDIETCRNIPRDSVVRNTAIHQKENKTSPVVSMNTMLQDSRLTIYKVDNNSLCKTPHIKKPLTVKTPRSGKALVRRPLVDSRRTPLKAVGQLGTPKYQSPKSILKTPRN
ncbi:Rho GTPase-activating protein 11A [Melipona quadrifasciata]|uniref:Rho GTPase-activating protein 11A n=1 Tax=Melipona quadrifasciata TaxID=166423 RepID=A0A0M8ZVE1_9HYME|nr:Rho GTPase-activating protein 11A [Melipona quadrifasciata]